MARWLLVLSLATIGLASGCRRSRMPTVPGGSSVVVAADSAEDAGDRTIQEIEPNDLLATAQRIDLGPSPAVMIVGDFATPPGSRARDVDLFRIAVPPPPVVIEGPDGAAPSVRQLLVIEVDPDPHLAVAVDALDDQGKILVAATGSPPGESEMIPNLSVIPGSYFIRVKPVGPAEAAGAGRKGAPDSPSPPSVSTGGPLGYHLKARLAVFEKGDEIEPNGTAALANEAEPGGDVAGFLGWRHDEDWFRLPLSGLPEGSALSIDLDPIGSGSVGGGGGVAASVTVYDSVEQKLTEQKGRRGERVAIRNVRLPSSDPCVFVVVKAESGRQTDAKYTLHLRTDEARSDAELEPNDDPAHAVPLTDGTFLGYLGPGDVDVYRYTAPLPVELSFEATPPEHVDLKVELLREDGTVLARVDSGHRREAERLPNLYVEGSVLLRLSAGKGDGNVDEPYRITTSSRPVEPGAEREPNGTPGQATHLEPDRVGTGLIFPKGDTDFWQTSTAARPGEQLAIAVSGIAGMSLDVRVVEPGGKDRVRFRVGGTASAPLRLAAPNQPGETCCLLQIRESTGRLANARDRYSVSVTAVTP